MNTKIILIGNIVSLIGSSFLFLSSTGKSKNGVLAFQTAGSGFLVVSGLLLRAYSGVAQDVISVIRNLTVIKKVNSKILSFIFIGAGLVLGIGFNNFGAAGLLPVFANFEFSCIVLYPKSGEITTKIAVIISNLCWAAYDIITKNYTGFAINLATATSSLIFIIRAVIRRRKAKITSLEAQPLSCTDKAE